MKKKAFICCSAVAAVIACVLLYVFIGTKHIEDKTWDYLAASSYSESDIQDVSVKHSFAGLALSYDEWIIAVVYTDEPESTYTYTLRDGEIVQTGVSSKLDKDELKH